MRERPLLKRRKDKGYAKFYHHCVVYAPKDEIGKPDLTPL